MTELDLWTEVYVAALKGFYARGDYEHEEEKQAASRADRAVKEWREHTT